MPHSIDKKVLPILAQMEELTKELRQIVSSSNPIDAKDLDFAKHLVVLGTAIVALQKNILER